MTDQSIPRYKICGKCGERKTRDTFESYRKTCRDCRSKYNKQYRQSPHGQKVIADKITERRQRTHPAIKARCPKCEKTKPSFDFTRSSDRPNGLSCYCKQCTHYGQRITALKKRGRKWDHLMREFGVSRTQYEEMSKAQNNLCKICQQTPEAGKYLAVDHNHVTGKVRGLLCVKCNAALGIFRDSIEMLEAAIKYLREHD